MDNRNASRITLSQSLKNATFHLAGWSLSHQTELPDDLPVPLECYALTLNTIELQLSDAVADTSLLLCSAQFRILFDNASHALASSATVRSTFYVEEEVVVICNGWTPKKEVCIFVCIYLYIFPLISLALMFLRFFAVYCYILFFLHSGFFSYI